MLNLKSKLAEKQQYKCLFCQLEDKLSITTIRQEFKNEGGFELKIPFCPDHNDNLNPELIVAAVKKALTPPDDGQMSFDEGHDREEEKSEHKEETKAVAVRRRRDNGYQRN